MTVAPAAVIPPPTPAAEVGAAPEDRAAPLADAPAPVAHSSSGKLADSGVDVGFAPLLGLAALALGAALIVRSRRSAHTVAQRRRN